ncbi:hypothetical protein MANES_05G070650v8 [Manihot esculenta]|nr:hypothetical protein MANES_05G070650v8 [Manihot esculenta]
MKPIIKISNAAEAELLSRHSSPIFSNSLTPFTFTLTTSPVYRLGRRQTHALLPSNFFPYVIPFSTASSVPYMVSHFRDEFVQHGDDIDINAIEDLEEKSDSLTSRNHSADRVYGSSEFNMGLKFTGTHR